MRNDARPIGHADQPLSPVSERESEIVARRTFAPRERQTHTVNRPADEGGQLETDEDRRPERG